MTSPPQLSFAAAVRTRVAILAVIVLSGASGCGDDGGGPNRDAGFGDAQTPDAAAVPDASSEPDAGPSIPPPPPGMIEIVAEPQREGDPTAGYDQLVNGGYVGCGIPFTAYRAAFGVAAPEELRLPGRNASNETLPFGQTRFTTRSGVDVVSANCLTCHAHVLLGRVVIGLGNPDVDFTNDPSGAAELAGNFITDPAERVEWRKWADRVQATAPYIQTEIFGMNPADNLAGALFTRRDPVTLAWSDTDLLEPPSTNPAPLDTPPWWHMKKKNAMFFTGSGRGDHARIMMAASTLCVDEVAEARDIDAEFDDVRAYILSIEPPPYPFQVDADLAGQGRPLFEQTCAPCHGTYGDRALYPNLLAPQPVVGTDPLVALGEAQFSERFVDWFNGSFFGEISRFETTGGYVAPPLDGIWATAPYLHNGSVPTLATLLESAARPTYWTRSFQSDDYDASEVGWVYTELDHGYDAEPNPSAKKRIYDTTRTGYTNTGHTFGDILTETERAAVIEYLKTL